MRTRVQPLQCEVEVVVAGLVGSAFKGLKSRPFGLKGSALDLKDWVDPVKAMSSFVANYIMMHGSPRTVQLEIETWVVDFVLRVLHMLWTLDRVHTLYRNNVVGALYGCMVVATKLYLDDLRYTTVSMFVRMVNWMPIDAQRVTELEVATFTALIRSDQPFACLTRCGANSIRSHPEHPKKCTSGKTRVATRWFSPSARQVQTTFSRGGKKDQKTLCQRP